MVTVTNRAQRITESAEKIESPFVLDPTLCLYSPQDNVDSLTHPRIASWLDFMRDGYEPKLPEAKRRVLLFMPCTKTKALPVLLRAQGDQPASRRRGFPADGAARPAAGTAGARWSRPSRRTCSISRR